MPSPFSQQTEYTPISREDFENAPEHIQRRYVMKKNFYIDVEFPRFHNIKIEVTLQDNVARLNYFSQSHINLKNEFKNLFAKMVAYTKMWVGDNLALRDADFEIMLKVILDYYCVRCLLHGKQIPIVDAPEQ
jgi:hypothetical protein